MLEVLVGKASDNYARVIREWEVRSHLGRILTYLEAIGLPEKQERAIKDLIKQSTWRDLWNDGTPIIYSKEADELLQKAIEKEYEVQSYTASSTASSVN